MAQKNAPFLCEESDVRRLVKLLGEVVLVEGDLAAKRVHLMRGLCRIIGADAWAWSLVHMQTGEPPRQVVFLNDGVPEERFHDYVYALEHPDMKWALGKFVEECLAAGRPFTRRDAQILPGSFDELLATSDPFKAWNRVGFRSFMLMAWPLAGGGYSGIGIYRRDGRPDFTARESRIAHIVLTEIPWLHEEGWSAERGRTLGTLGPRLREVLHFLIQAHPRKLIAADLGLSLNTVHGYVREIYRHFGVNSHAGLIAHFTCGDGGDAPGGEPPLLGGCGNHGKSRMSRRVD